MGTYGYAAPEYVMTGKFSLIWQVQTASFSCYLSVKSHMLTRYLSLTIFSLPFYI